jgi:hypothetical protein
MRREVGCRDAQRLSSSEEVLVACCQDQLGVADRLQGGGMNGVIASQTELLDHRRCTSHEFRRHFDDVEVGTSLANRVIKPRRANSASVDGGSGPIKLTPLPARWDAVVSRAEPSACSR